MSRIIPFRTPQKIKALAQQGLIESRPYYQLHPIPKYNRRNLVQYSHVHGFGSWMVDVAFIAQQGEVIQATEDNPQLLEQERRSKQIAICLICIHCNSRFAYVRIIPNRTTQAIHPVIKDLTQLGYPCDTIISDADASIIAAVNAVPSIKRHITYNMSDTKFNVHSTLAIIDRFTRTLRDMIFTAKISLNPQTLAELMTLYNNTPHLTLTKVMGFKVTPTEMLTYGVVQQEYIRRVSAGNASKFDELSTAFKVGDLVYIYQPPSPFIKRRNSVMDDVYRVLDVRGGRYLLENTRTLEKIQRPRSYLISFPH